MSKSSEDIKKSMAVFKRPVYAYELRTICGFTDRQIERACAEGILAMDDNGAFVLSSERTDRQELEVLRQTIAHVAQVARVQADHLPLLGLDLAEVSKLARTQERGWNATLAKIEGAIEELREENDYLRRRVAELEKEAAGGQS